MKLVVEKTQDGIELNRKNVYGKTLSCVEGLCAANTDYPTQPRDRTWYIKNIIIPRIERGEMSDGSSRPYDDRKIRFDRVSMRDDALEVRLGITTFQDCSADIHRNEEENYNLQKRGLKEFKDAYAFFSRPLGVSAVPITKEHSIFLGKRINTKEYPGFLTCVGGYVNYSDSPGEINLEQNARRELEEEMGVMPGDIEFMNLIGLFGNQLTGEVDFTFLAHTNLPDKYFSSGEWKKARDREHGDLIQVATYEQMQRIVKDTPGEIMYPLLGALQSITPEDLVK